MPLEAIFYNCQPILFENIGSRNYIPNYLKSYFYINRGSISDVISSINSLLYLPKLSPKTMDHIARSITL